MDVVKTLDCWKRVTDSVKSPWFQVALPQDTSGIHHRMRKKKNTKIRKNTIIHPIPSKYPRKSWTKPADLVTSKPTHLTSVPTMEPQEPRKHSSWSRRLMERGLQNKPLPRAQIDPSQIQWRKVSHFKGWETWIATCRHLGTWALSLTLYQKSTRNGSKTQM